MMEKVSKEEIDEMLAEIANDLDNAEEDLREAAQSILRLRGML